MARRASVRVVQESAGVNAHFRAATNCFAAEGHVAVARAIFDRFDRGLDIGYVAQSRTLRMDAASKADFEQVLRDSAAAPPSARFSAGP